MQAFILVAFGRHETCYPGDGFGLVVLEFLDGIVEEDENDGKEDDVCDDDQNNDDAPPLKLYDATHTSVCLSRGHGPDAVGVRRPSGSFGRHGIVREGGEIDFDAVAKGRELDDDGKTGEYQQRDPEIRQTVFVVDVAGLAEAEGDAAEDQKEDESDDGNTPAENLGEPHVVPSHYQLPADLQM